MKLLFSVILIVFNSTLAIKAQDADAFLLFGNRAQIVNYEEMVNDLAQSDMVFFGEYHDNPISHWFELKLAKSLFAVKGAKLLLGAEMFEAGNQLVLDEYLNGLYDHDKLLPEITQLWSNYKTDYRPLLQFAQKNGLRFIASNIPRRYANMIYRKGAAALNELSTEALAYISPNLLEYFDPTIKAYAEMAQMMGVHVPENMYNIQLSQASKDATMAYFSLKYYRPGDLLLHFEGSYHSDYNQGIIWWVNRTQPGLSIKSVTTVTRSEWNTMSYEERTTIANYIIVVDDDMTKTM